MTLAAAVLLLKLAVFSLVPFALAAQGTMLSGRAGVFPVMQEGVMLAAAAAGFLAAWRTGSPAIGMLVAMITGGGFGLLLAFATVTLRFNQFVCGLALFFLGVALSTLMPRLVIGVTLTPPLVPTLPDLPLPFLCELPLIGPCLFAQNFLVYFALVSPFALHWFLQRTRLGLNLRACGENPEAADAAGVNVTVMRYGACIAGGMLMGLGGVYLPLAGTGTFTENMVRGRGWLSTALAFFGFWQPLPILAGSAFFAGMEVYAFRAQVRGSELPYQVLLMLPYVATLLVMMASSRRVRPPAALGRNYDREARSAE